MLLITLMFGSVAAMYIFAQVVAMHVYLMDMSHRRAVAANRATFAQRTVKQRALLTRFVSHGTLTKADFKGTPIMNFGLLASLIKSGIVTKDNGTYSLAVQYVY